MLIIIEKQLKRQVCINATCFLEKFSSFANIIRIAFDMPPLIPLEYTEASGLFLILIGFGLAKRAESGVEWCCF